MELFLSDHHGIYIPRDFAKCVKREFVDNVSDENWAILEAGPDHEWYWEAWDEVLSNAVINDPVSGKKLSLYQDGDLWTIEEGEEIPDLP